MNQLGRQRGAKLEPWQGFDMIAGTSTGGLIAIMLGRLRMSVSECIEAYTNLPRSIFTPSHHTRDHDIRLTWTKLDSVTSTSPLSIFSLGALILVSQTM
jgi:patatin-like phospholipase/acyl hydrolase